MMTSRRTNQSTCFILILVMSLHNTMACISAHENTPAFVLQNYSPLMHKPGRSKRTQLSYVDDEEVVSPTKSVDVDEGDKANIESGIIEDHTFDEDDDTVEEKTDWLSATRTLGSLFLRQEDEDRDKNVDVFGRALVGNETDDVEGGLLHENSIANYLMNLKKQEEDNRERSAEHRHQSKKSKDASGGGMFQQKLSPEDVS